MVITAEHERITSLHRPSHPRSIADESRDPSPLLRDAREQIDAWFARRLHRFDLPLAPAPTPAQYALRAFLLNLPFGNTCSYKDAAETLGSAPRAIGGGCGRNPFPLVVPCHRIIASDGTLGGYSGFDGLATKKWLLAFERNPACFT